MLTDSHSRTVSYLRLSVTDRCNLHCLYCRPQAGWPFIPHEEILSYEEMLELAAVAEQAGVEKIRLTGGEPFMRKDFLSFVARLHAGFPRLDLRITTNGTFLAEYAVSLREVGVSCLNISLDTLQREKFRTITGQDEYECVRHGIDACLDAGLRVKINVVALKGVNDDELPAFLDFARNNVLDVRFIEFMPIGQQSRWSQEKCWTAQEILSAIERLTTLSEVCAPSPNSGPAQMYSLPQGQGRIGVISAVSNHFCATCNRFRITSDGRLRTCLYSDREYDVRAVLRATDYSRSKMSALFEQASQEKPLGYHLLRDRTQTQVCRKAMTAIGG